MAPDKTASELRSALSGLLREFSDRINITDWTGATYALGLAGDHWRALPLDVHIKTREAGEDLLAMNGLRFLERFVAGDVDLEGNLYLLSNIRYFIGLVVPTHQYLGHLISNKSTVFQNRRRAKLNVRSHYDLPQEIFSTYLDQVYLAYSCAMFENPDHIAVDELLKKGYGKSDAYDSLEKAQWRKFKDAVEFTDPSPGQTLLDVGCGYGGQLLVALEHRPFAKVVGWTHSHNQIAVTKKILAGFDHNQWEVHEGDYREDERVFDHITSTGMISHVGPRGLIPYVRNIRKRIRTGGCYVHHAIMVRYSKLPLDANVGVAFNKKYIWPGFHWFTLGQHIFALERNGFEITRLVNLAPHYAKTTAAWYERMMANHEIMTENLGEPTFRAWQIYLSGGSEDLRNGTGQVYRIYCRAI
ncbi:class I SAM-dependent methyltransferase [Gammaproteobacteria bacterium]|nr:class I SAM-dependent methyltransferase [Gammaproteobacteria bacterium]